MMSTRSDGPTIWAALLTLVSTTVAIAGCGGAAMTATEVSTYGTTVIDGTPDQVYQATLGALRAEGYQIATERPDRGLIITDRRDIRTDAHYSTGGSYAMTSVYTRQYTMELTTEGEGHVRVVATPALFQNGIDISSRSVWDLTDDTAGERVLWNRLFARIRQLL
jgi:hypothetical protein